MIFWYLKILNYYNFKIIIALLNIKINFFFSFLNFLLSISNKLIIFYLIKNNYFKYLWYYYKITKIKLNKQWKIKFNKLIQNL